MIKPLLAVLLSLFALNAFAGIENFKNFASGKIDRDRVDQSVVHLFFRADNFSDASLQDADATKCTGTFVSSDGYVLTAKHCIEPMLSEEENALLRETFSYPEKAKVYLKHPLRIKMGAGSKALDAEIVAIGGDRDWESLYSIRPRDLLEYREVVQSLIDEEGFGFQSDWAVLKVKSIHPQACLPISQAALDPGSELIHLGFPGFAGREVLSGGRDFYFSRGEVYSGSMDAYFDAQTDAMIPTPEDVAQRHSMSPEEKKAYEKNYPAVRSVFRELNAQVQSRGMILSSAPVAVGMSGGPTLNSAGQIIGVNVAALKGESARSLSNSIRSILEGVERSRLLLGTPSSAVLFRCQ